MIRSRPALVPALASFALAVLSAAAAAQGPACLSLAVDGVELSADFQDGFESGTIAPWLAPVPSGIDASRTLDLAARVELPAEVTGSHLLELRFFLPGGSLYQSMTFPIAAGVSLKSFARAVPDYPFPVAVHGAVWSAKSSGGWTVEEYLPVAGTPILESSLYGTWTLAAHLDQREEPCITPLAFDLQP